MRLEGIGSIEAAQAFVPRFIAWWNARFAVTPREARDAHRPWTEGRALLAERLARHEERVLSKALTFRAEGRLHALNPHGPGTALRGAKVTLHHHLDGSLKLSHKGRPLAYTAFGPDRAPARAEDEKTLDTRLDALVAGLAAAA